MIHTSQNTKPSYVKIVFGISLTIHSDYLRFLKGTQIITIFSFPTYFLLAFLGEKNTTNTKGFNNN